MNNYEESVALAQQNGGTVRMNSATGNYFVAPAEQKALAQSLMQDQAANTEGNTESNAGQNGTGNSQNTASGIPVDPELANGVFRVRLKMPDGSWKFSKDQQEIDVALKTGAKAIHNDGSEASVKDFQGGTLIDGLPINTVLTGQIQQAQVDALKQGGLWNSTWNNLPVEGTTKTAGGTTQAPGNPVTPQTPGTGTTPPPGTGQTPGTPFEQPPNGTLSSENFNALMQQLLNSTGAQGQAGQANLAQIAKLLSGQLGFNQQTAQQLLGQQQNAAGYLGTAANSANTQAYGNEADIRNYVNMFTNELNPTLNHALGFLDRDPQGLNPGVMAALNTQAIEGPQAAYQNSVGQLKTRLLESGAAGGGDMPGSASAIAAGYGPLLQTLTSQQEGLQQQAQLANQQQMNTNRGFDMQAGLGAAGAITNQQNSIANAYNPANWLNNASGLLSTQLGAYNPNAYLEGTNTGLSSLLNAANAGGQLGLQGANINAGLAGTLGQLQPGSFQNTLYAALLGTGLSAINTPTSQGGSSILSSILGSIFGNGGNSGNTNGANGTGISLGGFSLPTGAINNYGGWGSLSNPFGGESSGTPWWALTDPKPTAVTDSGLGGLTLGQRVPGSNTTTDSGLGGLTLGQRVPGSNTTTDSGLGGLAQKNYNTGIMG